MTSVQWQMHYARNRVIAKHAAGWNLNWSSHTNTTPDITIDLSTLAFMSTGVVSWANLSTASPDINNTWVLDGGQFLGRNADHWHLSAFQTCLPSEDEKWNHLKTETETCCDFVDTSFPSNSGKRLNLRSYMHRCSWRSKLRKPSKLCRTTHALSLEQTRM